MPAALRYHSAQGTVAAYVERSDRQYREWFGAAVEAGGAGPRDRILSVFDALAVQTQPDVCRGCPFLMALSEFPDRGLPAHRNAVANKAWVREQFGVLARESGAGDPDRLADHLTLIMEGVYASVQALGADGPARHARSLVESLL